MAEHYRIEFLDTICLGVWTAEDARYWGSLILLLSMRRNMVCILSRIEERPGSNLLRSLAFFNLLEALQTEIVQLIGRWEKKNRTLLRKRTRTKLLLVFVFSLHFLHTTDTPRNHLQLSFLRFGFDEEKKSHKDVVSLCVCVCVCVCIYIFWVSIWGSLPTVSAERRVWHLVSSTFERNSQIIQRQMCLKCGAVAMYLAYLWSSSYTLDFKAHVLCSDKAPKKCQIQVWDTDTRL